MQLVHERRAKSASLIKHAYQFHLAVKAVRNAKEEKRRRGLLMEEAVVLMAAIPSSFKELRAAFVVMRRWLLHYRRMRAGAQRVDQLMKSELLFLNIKPYIKNH